MAIPKFRLDRIWLLWGSPYPAQTGLRRDPQQPSPEWGQAMVAIRIDVMRTALSQA